jgi:hypothetical protein
MPPKAFGGQAVGLTGGRPLYVSEYSAGATASPLCQQILTACSAAQLQEKPILRDPRGFDPDT